MQLAEALSRRKHYVASLDENSRRLRGLATTCVKKNKDELSEQDEQEIKSNTENAEAALVTHATLCTELYTLKYDVAITNASASVDGVNLIELLAKRKILSRTVKRYEEMLQPAVKKLLPTTLNEKRSVVSFNQKEMRKRYEMLAKELRHLNAKIQTTGWQTELLAGFQLDLETARV